MSYRRYTEEERAAWLAKFERSAASAAAFCREHGISYGGFMRWRRQAAPEPEPSAPEPADFIEFEVPRSSEVLAPVQSGQSVELCFPCGLTLRIVPTPPAQP